MADSCCSAQSTLAVLSSITAAVQRQPPAVGSRSIVHGRRFWQRYRPASTRRRLHGLGTVRSSFPGMRISEPVKPLPSFGVVCRFDESTPAVLAGGGGGRPPGQGWGSGECALVCLTGPGATDDVSGRTEGGPRTERPTYGS